MSHLWRKTEGTGAVSHTGFNPMLSQSRPDAACLPRLSSQPVALLKTQRSMYLKAFKGKGAKLVLCLLMPGH